VPNVVKIWEPKPPGTLSATPGQLWDCFAFVYATVSPKVSSLTYKSRAKRKMLLGIYSAICGKVNVSVSVRVEVKGDYIEKYQICIISVTLKKLVRTETFGPSLVYIKK
jgi:hypothetical protein